MYNRVKKDGITNDLLLELHVMLTDSLDELFLNKWVKHYSPYFQWTFRDKDNVVVGWMRPGRASDIPNVLDDINKRSKEVKTIEDIFWIHKDMYRAHLFYNGNKRICRCVEIILNNRYGFLKYLPLSVWNYFNHDKYLSALVWYCFRNDNYYWFARYSFSLLFAVFIDKIYNFIYSQLVIIWYTWEAKLSEEILDDFLSWNVVAKQSNNSEIDALRKKLYKDKELIMYFYKKALSTFFSSSNTFIIDERKHIRISFPVKDYQLFN